MCAPPPFPCRLAELNVKRQVFNVCTSPAVQRAWEEGKSLSVHGFMFVVEKGILVVRCRQGSQWLITGITALQDSSSLHTDRLTLTRLSHTAIMHTGHLIQNARGECKHFYGTQAPCQGSLRVPPALGKLHYNHCSTSVKPLELRNVAEILSTQSSRH